MSKISQADAEAWEISTKNRLGRKAPRGWSFKTLVRELGPLTATLTGFYPDGDERRVTIEWLPAVWDDDGQHDIGELIWGSVDEPPLHMATSAQTASPVLRRNVRTRAGMYSEVFDPSEVEDELEPGTYRIISDTDDDE